MQRLVFRIFPKIRELSGHWSPIRLVVVLLSLVATLNFAFYSIGVLLEWRIHTPCVLFALIGSGLFLLIAARLLSVRLFGERLLRHTTLQVTVVFGLALLMILGTKLLFLALVLSLFHLVVGSAAGWMKRRHADHRDVNPTVEKIALAVVFMLLLGPYLGRLYAHTSWSTFTVGPGGLEPVRSDLYQINEDGYRGPRIDPSPSASQPRLLFLGDSSTFGFGVPAEAAYPARIESLLHQRGYEDARCLNAGVNSAGIREVAGRYKRFNVWDPDLVFLMEGIHFKDTESRSKSRIPGWLSIRLLSIGQYAATSSSDMPVEFQEKAWASHLEKLISEIIRDGHRPVLLIYPSPSLRPELVSIQRELAEKWKIDMIDLRSQFGPDCSEFLLIDGIHPNEKGYKRIASSVVTHLLSSGSNLLGDSSKKDDSAPGTL